MIVVDASVLTDFLLGRAQTMDALDAELAGREHEPLHAPDLVELETLNALRRLVSSGAVTDRRATGAAADLANARPLRYPHAPLRELVWALRDEFTAYDAAYVALARRSQIPSSWGAIAGSRHARDGRSEPSASASCAEGVKRG